MPLCDGGSPEPPGVTGTAGCIAGDVPGAAESTGGAGWGGPAEGQGTSGVAGVAARSDPSRRGGSQRCLAAPPPPPGF